MSEKLTIQRIWETNDSGVALLLAKSDEYLSSLYPSKSIHAEPLDALIGDDSVFFAAYIDDELAACGAVKLIEDDLRYGEIKRVFVEEKQRGQGLATAVIRYLENFLMDGGVGVARLETGTLQPDALRLYHKLGYFERGPFGAYKPDPLSIFMEKNLFD